MGDEDDAEGDEATMPPLTLQESVFSSPSVSPPAAEMALLRMVALASFAGTLFTILSGVLGRLIEMRGFAVVSAAAGIVF